MRSHEPQTLDFFDRAPMRITESATIGAPPLQVFAAFADVRSWPKWFPLMRTCEWVSQESERVGAEREVSLHLLGRFREKFIAWDPGERFAFTMTASTSPLASAIAEDFRMSPVRDGEATRISWTLAAEPTTAGRLAEPLLAATMRRVFLRGGRNLEARLVRR